MMRRTLGCLLVFSSSLWAQASGAVLQVGGAVQVNGKSVSHSAVLFDSDTVQTSSASAASITQSGSSVIIGSNSQASYSKQAVTLASGSATITTSQQFGARVGSVYVQPSSANARFAVQQTPSQIQIASLDGDLAVNLATKVVTVSSGNSLTLPLVAAALQETGVKETKDERDRRCSEAKRRGVKEQDCDDRKGAQDPTPRLEDSGDTRGNAIAAAGGALAAVATILTLINTPLSPGGP